jgi:hypothetical protein
MRPKARHMGRITARRVNALYAPNGEDASGDPPYNAPVAIGGDANLARRRSVAAAVAWVAVLLCGLVHAQVSSDTPPADEPVLLETPYYTIHGQLDPAIVREAALRLPTMAEEYLDRTRDFSGRIQEKLPFYLYDDEQAYLAAGGTAGTVGLYDGERLMALSRPGEELSLWHTVQHEAFHQFAEAVIRGPLPMWVNEGLADYFGEAMFVGDDYVVGLVPTWRLARLKRQISDGQYMPFEQFMDLTHDQWNAELDPGHYDQAWAMVQYLVHAKDGRYNKSFTAFVQALSHGHPWRKAWRDTIGPIDGFEQAWRTYWLAQPEHPTADAYAEGCVRILTHWLARSHAAGMIVTDPQKLLAEAAEGRIPMDPAEWLPASLAQVARVETKSLAEQGYAFAIQTGRGLPQVVATAPDGGRIIGRFTMKAGRIRGVQIRRPQ